MVKPKLKVICNKGCNKEFKVQKIRKQLTFHDPIHGKVIFYYFNCPKCKQKYITHTENERINELINEVKMLKAQSHLVATQTTEEAMLHISRIQQIKRNIQNIQKYLKEKYGFA